LAGVLASLAARDLAQRRADERMRAERALTATEQRLATAVDAADLGTWRWEADGDVLYASQRCVSLLGLGAQAPDQRAGRWSDLLARVHPDDRARLGAAVQRCLLQAGLLDIEFRVRLPGADCPDGWVQMTGGRQDGSGQVAAGLQGVLADASASKQAKAERLDLLRRLAQAQEDERRRISRELHDQVGQTVTGLALGLKALEASLEGDGPVARDRASRVGWLRTLAAEIGRDIHQAAADLRPAALDDLGIDKALEALASDWGDRYGVQVDVQTIGEERARLPPEVEIVVYRVVQEALTNVLKHADARGVSVVLDHAATQFRVIVEDDGKGFDTQAFDRSKRATSRFGLSGMRERLARIGGTMMIESTPSAGTSVFIQIPLAAASGRQAA
jgi:two-component system sensor histidine kinase UhpB